MRHLDEMAKYREDLDKVREEKNFIKNRSVSEQEANLSV